MSDGDAACWLDQVCDICGALVERGASHVHRRPATPDGAPAVADQVSAEE